MDKLIEVDKVVGAGGELAGCSEYPVTIERDDAARYGFKMWAVKRDMKGNGIAQGS